VFAFPLADGSVLTCGTIRLAATFTPPGVRGTLTQDDDHHPWGPTVAPGRYQAVQVEHLDQVCTASRPDGQGGVDVVSEAHAAVSAVGLA
jgi:hypothetical protein